MARIRSTLSTIIVFACFAAAHPALAETPPEPALSPREVVVFQQVCATCHARPGIGVPILGDETEWEPRRSKGLEILLRNTIDGSAGMPPLGTCSFCSEAELRRLVSFLAGLPLETTP